jgi:predicted MFS family arabinose efflux permease
MDRFSLDGSGPDEASGISRKKAWFAFFMLFLLMLSDYIDRQIIVSLFPHIKEEWGVSDKQLGALVSIISIVVALGSLPVALLADRYGRVKSVVLMASIWSFATIACMFTRNYSQLFAARAVVGLGETGYGSVGAALVNALFPKRLHSTLLGAFFAAGSLGSVLGVVLGGVISDHWGWRAAFGVVGVPGLLIAILFALVPDYKTKPLELAARTGTEVARGPLRLYRMLTSGPTLLWASLAGSLQLIVMSSIWAWTPSYFNRYYGMDVTAAAKHAAAAVLCGAIGAVLWSFVADRVSRRNAVNKLYLMCVLTLLTCAVFGYAFLAPLDANARFIGILLGSLLMSCAVGAVTSTVLDVTHPALRSTGGAVLALFQNLFGLAIGPFVGGWISDLWGLSTALSVMPCMSVLSALCFWMASRTYLRDMQAVASRS